jgi:regulator of sigma E protease
VTSILAFLLVLGVLIFVHELGHFLAARRLGVRVLTFSLGFGPKLVNIKRGDTEYCVSAIPLGGYVKMAGENPDDSRSGRSDEFLSRTKWERFQILIAGAAMNILLAVVVMAVVVYQGAEVPLYEDQPPVVGAVMPGSPADAVGIRPGERILAVGGRTVETWQNLMIEVMQRPDREALLVLVRDGQTLELTVRTTAEGRFEVGDIGVLPHSSPIVLSVNPGSPAERAGLQPGDVVLAVGGASIAHRVQLIEVISRSAGQELELTVLRDSREVRLRGVPEQEGDRAMLGFAITEPTRLIEPGMFGAIALSVERNYEWSGLIFRAVGGLITGETSVRQLQGPVGIGVLAGESAQQGVVALLALMAIISLNLGILNLLPIPVLDGGHILIMALEGIARRDFSMQVKEKMLVAGFLALMVLMVTVIYNDLTRISWIERLMPWRQ